MLFCSLGSFIERPENGITKGVSSLEVTLEETKQEEGITPSTIPHKPSQREATVVAKKITKLPHAVSPRSTGSLHRAEQASSASSGTTDVTPSYLHNPQPLYPEQERRNGHEGTVLLRVAINEQGTITHVGIEHSSGYSALDNQARQTVERSWSFRPARLHGQPIASTVLIPIHFSLKE